MLLVPVGGLDDEDHVHVADVVELVPAALAHRDHGETGRRGLLADPGPGDRKSRVQGAGGEVGQLGGDVVDPHAVGQVTGREREQATAVLDPQRVDGLRVVAFGHRRCGGRVRPDRLEEPGPDGVGRRAGRPERRVGQVAPVLGMPQQVVAERRARPEDREQPHRGALVGGDLLEHRVPVVGPVGEVRQEVRGLVRVGRRRHEVQDLAGDVTEPVQRRRGPLRVAEAQPGEPPGGRADPAVAHARARPVGAVSPANRWASSVHVARSSSSAAATSQT